MKLLPIGPQMQSDLGNDKRQSVRKPGNFSATILLEDGHRIRCLVKDFSKGGALLIVPSILGIPERFVLQTAAGFSRRVRVRRMGPSRVGVQFI